MSLGKRVVILASALGVCGAILVAFVAVTRAQSGDEGEAAEANAPDPDPTPPDFFESKVPDDAIPYEELSADEKQQVDRTSEWVDTHHGESVLQAWRGASRFGRAYGALKRAEHAANLEGIADVGVE